MTDTTDTKALREQPSPHGIYQLVMDENEALRRLLLEAQQVIAQRNGECDRLINELEAERQRAAGSEEELHKALHREKAAERKLLAAQEEIAELKAKLANPVVLEYRKHDGFTDPEKVRLINAVTDRCAGAIKESGFAVKGGE